MYNWEGVIQYRNMIALIDGRVIGAYTNTVAVLTNGGVAYEVRVAAPFFMSIREGQTLTLFTYLKVSDSGMELFGFSTIDDKLFFELLLSVNGVGPRTALNILSLGSLDDIKSAIARADVTYLTQVAGIGRKTAERIVIELKNKLAMSNEQLTKGATGEALGEVVEALVGLGYSRDEARDVVKELDPKGKSTEALLKVALQRFKR